MKKRTSVIKVSPLDVKLLKFRRKVNTKNAAKGMEIGEWISKQLDLEEDSINNHVKKMQNVDRLHPVRPVRGEIFMAEMGSNVGVEFNSYHPVLVIQNDRGNSIGETTVVLPITDCRQGERVNKTLHQKIFNTDLISKEKNGLDKEPSKVKIADLMTIDKARLKTKVGQVSPRFLGIIEKKVKKILDFS